MDAGVPMISVVTATSCCIFPDGNLYLDPSSVEEEVMKQQELPSLWVALSGGAYANSLLQEAVSWVTTARSSTSDGVLTCITNGAR
ncbi:unnamed protein product [Phytophthora lilii]|uniref:Unnamed protein product n=1 Tax=Phytophthora lilii TaxID=2077276 RepID=A0A9W6TDG0_9STRA|nr:unnamed protein product [Phytophthora lilii]